MTTHARFADDIDSATVARIEATLLELDLTELTGDLSIQRLVGGGMNQNFVIDSTVGRYVLRIAGTEIERYGIDRELGVSGHRHAAAAGVAPRLCGVVMPQADLVVPFVQGRVLDGDILCEPGVLERCVDLISRTHYAEPVDGEFSIFQDARRYLGIIADEKLTAPSDLDHLAATMSDVEDVFAAVNSPKVLGHNDLQLQNFIIGDDRAWLLDWEYTGMSNPYLDLSMLLCYGDVPTDRRDAALQRYFGVIREADHARIELMYLAATMREALWAIAASPLNAETGFDYRAWADKFVTRAHKQVSSEVFGKAMKAAGPVEDDARIFERARAIALDSADSAAV
ncbi:MAG: hypothetical protein EOP24_35820 [Hyphomicrobiales bacterium]|nr:MAG: hypothetical protein EOP24_35820 [Hyphomicrobiales bacterium]